MNLAIFSVLAFKQGLCLCLNRANQLVPQLLMKQSDTYNIDTLNICMKKFGAKKLIIVKMIAL